MALIIRAAAPRDAAAVAGLVEAMGGHEGAVTNPEVAVVYHETLECDRVRMLVAEEEGRVIGYAEVQARPYMLDGVRQGWLAALCVAPDGRGRGIGAALVEAVDAAAAGMGCDEVALESSSFRTRAHGFYRALGFHEVRPAVRLKRTVRARK